MPLGSASAPGPSVSNQVLEFANLAWSTNELIGRHRSNHVEGRSWARDTLAPGLAAGGLSRGEGPSPLSPSVIPNQTVRS